MVANTMVGMEGSMAETSARSWLRCYRCWSQDLEVQVHYEGIHKIDPDTGERAEVVDELQEAVVQCLECMHDQPHLGFDNGRVEPVEDRWERMIAGTPWVASCTVAVDADDVESCSGPEAGDALSYAAFGDHGVSEFFTHVRFHKHEDDSRIIVHLLVELYARSLEEATDVSESAARGALDDHLAGGGVAAAGSRQRSPRPRIADPARTVAARAPAAVRGARREGDRSARSARGSAAAEPATRRCRPRSSSADVLVADLEAGGIDALLADRRNQADRGLERRRPGLRSGGRPTRARGSSRRSRATGSGPSASLRNQLT